MKLQIVNDPTVLTKIQSIYEEAFPPEEKAPFSWLQDRAQKNQGTFYALVLEGCLEGFVYVVETQHQAYLFYLAIAQKSRGSGLGTGMMKELMKLYPDKVLFLAREKLDERAENAWQRQHRHAFYQKLGFMDVPFEIKEGVTLFDVMAFGGYPDSEEYTQMMKSWIGEENYDPQWVWMKPVSAQESE